MTRLYSNLINDEAKRWLAVIADRSTSHQIYQDAMTQLGRSLGSAMADEIGDTSQNVYLVATAEDADFLALGVLRQLETRQSSVGFACFWNERTSLFGLSTLAVAPILKQYTEPAERVDTLIVVKSIISGGCIVRTNLQNIIKHIQPRQIFIAAPVMYHRAEVSLREAFSAQVANKFRFFYLALDDERSQEGVVIPGIGGMVYDRLGFNGQIEKNSYIPTIVKQRRELILLHRKTNA